MTPTTTTLTTNEAAAAGAVLGGVFGIVGVLGIALVVLLIIAMWKLFKKAGEPGWKAIIPIYNAYILFKISGAKGWFWGVLISEIGAFVLSAIGMSTGSIVTDSKGNVVEIKDAVYVVVFCALALYQLIAYIILSAKMSRAFKRGLGTTLGLIFFPNIFTLILGFGSAKYDKKAVAGKK